MKKTVLIMAGGRGERFWPKSRRNLPKQFLSLTDDGKTMIQLTVERILPLVSLEDIFVATNESYRALVREQLPGLPEENILCEPMGRNTAPCIALGAAHMAARYGDAVMMVLPSDHLIQMPELFRRTLSDACDVAEAGPNLVTMGITPTYPETGYGYIHFDTARQNGAAFAVERFVEKPDRERARQYLESGEYLWNSGMFIWKISTILQNLTLHLPEMASPLADIRSTVGTPAQQETLLQAFPRMPSVSIDYGIMEKADRIFVLAGNFGWDDVGSWLSISRHCHLNEDGNVITVGTTNSVIQGREKLLAVVGLDNVIVVDTEDATLICAATAAGDIKKVLEELKQAHKEQYL